MTIKLFFLGFIFLKKIIKKPTHLSWFFIKYINVIYLIESNIDWNKSRPSVLARLTSAALSG